jgi:hypothetical protein
MSSSSSSTTASATTTSSPSIKWPRPPLSAIQSTRITNVQWNKFKQTLLTQARQQWSTNPAITPMIVIINEQKDGLTWCPAIDKDIIASSPEAAPPSEVHNNTNLYRWPHQFNQYSTAKWVPDIDRPRLIGNYSPFVMFETPASYASAPLVIAQRLSFAVGCSEAQYRYMCQRCDHALLPYLDCSIIDTTFIFKGAAIIIMFNEVGSAQLKRLVWIPPRIVGQGWSERRGMAVDSSVLEAEKEKQAALIEAAAMASTAASSSPSAVVTPVVVSPDEPLAAVSDVAPAPVPTTTTTPSTSSTGGGGRVLFKAKRKGSPRLVPTTPTTATDPFSLAAPAAAGDDTKETKATPAVPPQLTTSIFEMSVDDCRLWCGEMAWCRADCTMQQRDIHAPAMIYRESTSRHECRIRRYVDGHDVVVAMTPEFMTPPREKKTNTKTKDKSKDATVIPPTETKIPLPIVLGINGDLDIEDDDDDNDEDNDNDKDGEGDEQEMKEDDDDDSKRDNKTKDGEAKKDTTATTTAPQGTFPPLIFWHTSSLIICSSPLPLIENTTIPITATTPTTTAPTIESKSAVGAPSSSSAKEHETKAMFGDIAIFSFSTSSSMETSSSSSSSSSTSVVARSGETRTPKQFLDHHRICRHIMRYDGHQLATVHNGTMYLFNNIAAALFAPVPQLQPLPPSFMPGLTPSQATILESLQLSTVYASVANSRTTPSSIVSYVTVSDIMTLDWATAPNTIEWVGGTHWLSFGMRHHSLHDFLDH